jgi:hypothetical protein
VTSISERKRPQHLVWVGTTLPIDDPWWRTHYPPNGWNCKCRARPRSDDSRATLAQRRAPPLDLQPWRARSTGESRLVPTGIDPGWEHNPGLQRQRLAGQALTQRLDRMVDADARRDAVRRLRSDPAFDYLFETGNGFAYRRRLAPELADIGRQRWPVAVLPDALRETLGVETHVATLSVADAAKIAFKHPEVTAEFWDDLEEQISAGRSSLSGDGKLVLMSNWQARPWKIVLKRTAQGEVFVNSVHRIGDKTGRG